MARGGTRVNGGPCFTYDALGANGRLGNQLWQIAWQIGNASLFGGIARIRSDWWLRGQLQIPDELFEPPPPGRPVIDGGASYQQEIEHWWAYRKHLWTMFQPRAQLAQAVRSRRRQLGDDPGHRTAVHVRRGDYLRYPTVHPACPVAYYDRAMTLAIRQRPDTTFWIFSDDVAWCRDHLPVKRAILVGSAQPGRSAAEGETPLVDAVDLFVMAGCDAHVIANSSYSWWAGFLSGHGRAWYPEIWYGHDHPKALPHEMLPPKWTAVAVGP